MPPFSPSSFPRTVSPPFPLSRPVRGTCARRMRASRSPSCCMCSSSIPAYNYMACTPVPQRAPRPISSTTTMLYTLMPFPVGRQRRVEPKCVHASDSSLVGHAPEVIGRVVDGHAIAVARSSIFERGVAVFTRVLVSTAFGAVVSVHAMRRQHL